MSEPVGPQSDPQAEPRPTPAAGEPARPEAPARPEESAQPAAGQPATAQPAAGQPGSPGGYVLVKPEVPATVSGPGTGGLASGVLSCLLGALSCCWWPLLALPLVMGVAAVVLGYLGLRQVNSGAGQVSGKGVAIAAMVTGGVGVVLTFAAFLVGVVLRLA